MSCHLISRTTVFRRVPSRPLRAVIEWQLDGTAGQQLFARLTHPAGRRIPVVGQAEMMSKVEVQGLVKKQIVGISGRRPSSLAIHQSGGDTCFRNQLRAEITAAVTLRLAHDVSP